MTKPIYLTKEGYKQHLDNIKAAEETLRRIRRYKGEVAIHQGDNWHDNSTFDDTEMQERIAMKRLFDLEESKKNIVIIESSEDNTTVGINSIVTIEMNMEGEIETCKMKLIATEFSDLDYEVSINGPLGQAIFSKKVNDEVTYEVQGTKIKVKILKIE